MRAIVLLCLLHALGGETQYSWDGPVQTAMPQMEPYKTEPYKNDACLEDQASCGCCLLKTEMKRMKEFFNLTSEEMKKELKESKMILNNMRASRSAFSVALTDDKMSSCHGPFPDDSVITYKRVFLNLGDSYDMQTGRFTAPRSGVYSLAVTMYGAVTAGKMATCTQLQVNNREVTTLLERNGQDTQDSASVVVALRLKAGDQVAVKLLKGCSVCDSNNHYNTFTGFLLYATG
ncbi:complement C1q-like protein 2 [Echeneis naucrates]|uniref:complement C1q-like protein 2 n=1 Tax=Echeneis naucrates TaxID=173247 RepID=UPI0011135B6C|nr:complement C1q-like protein 2 [Echeneis naucrates]